MPISTRLTELLKVQHPIMLAPMDVVADGKLAATVSRAGGFGIIGGGYGNEHWLVSEFAAAGDARIGVGFITWSMAKNPRLLDIALERKPAAIMLSFGDVKPHAEKIKESGALMICQVQTVEQARDAVANGADVLVAQGAEAGGHGFARGTFALVPAVVDAARGIPVAAAGGVADGRGLAAALMLGADGVLIGSRLVASSEALTPHGFHDAILAADGDATVKTSVIDLVRNYPWPDEFSGRALKNDFVTRWHGRENALTDASTIASETERYWAAFSAGDADNAGVFMGEAAGLIHDIAPAAEIIERMVAQAHGLLRNAGRFVAG
jgi:nitronate monooxygenase